MNIEGIKELESVIQKLIREENLDLSMANVENVVNLVKEMLKIKELTIQLGEYDRTVEPFCSLDALSLTSQIDVLEDSIVKKNQ